MAFFATIAMLVLCQKKISGTWRQALLAGLLAGGLAGAKYTGCFVATGVAVAIAIEFRSARNTLLLCSGSLITGIWPYLRNFAWTGDPIFPFLTKTLSPETLSPLALTNLLMDTGASQPRHLGKLIPFICFAGMRQRSPGFWDFFGPIVFALSPLLIVALGKFRKWQAPAIVWWLSAIGIFYTSGLQRFLLPVFPLALVCLSEGIELTNELNWNLMRRLAATMTILLCIVGGIGLVIYSWAPVATSLGVLSQVRYSEERSPEYQQSEVINRVLGSQSKERKILVFVRHLYSLDVAFLNGDPATSWMINPDHLRTPRDWETFFQREGIAFVVRSPEYPAAIEVPLKEMEANGDLVLVSQSLVQDFHGKRIQGNRAQVVVTILRVKKFTETGGPGARKWD